MCTEAEEEEGRMKIKKGDESTESLSLPWESFNQTLTLQHNFFLPCSFQAQFVLDKPPELEREALKGKQCVG